MTASTATPAGSGTSTGGPQSALRRALPFVVLIVALVVLGLVARDGRSEGDPLDPRSTGPLGTRGLVLLLERFGADVRIGGQPDGRDGVAVLLSDDLNAAESERLQRWLERGGTLVVADPLSGFAPPIRRSTGGIFGGRDADDDGDGGGAADGLLRRRCELPALAGVGTIDVQSAPALRVDGGSTGCFPIGGGAFLVARAEGAGTVVALAGAGPLVNSQLDAADNAVLAVSLMAPRPGTTVTIVEPSLLGGGQRGLSELVSRRVKDGLWQLLVAFGLVALWRARRLGRPVREPQAVQIPGSELVTAVGNMLQVGHRREAAARMMRGDLRRTLSQRLGIPADAAPGEFAAAAAACTRLDPDSVAATLVDRPPTDDAGLVALAQSVENLRNEVVRAR